MKYLLVVLSLFGGVLATQAAATEAFVVNVPVEFKNLEPKVTAVAIHCKVLAVQPNGTFKEFQPVKTATVTPQSGNYAGTVKIVFQTEDFAPPERAVLNQVNRTRCTFTLVTAAGEFDPHDSKSPIGHNLAAPFLWQAQGVFAK